MVLRNVAKTFSLEEQRQEINEIAVDLDSVNTTLTNWNAADWDTAYSWGDHAQAGYWVDSATSRGNWDTAYGWGDHGTVGYWVEDSVKISNWDTAYGWGDHAQVGYALSTALANSANWDTAYGWGDHALAGYLTSYTETDPVFTASAASGIAAGDITNWNSAYGWGDHSTEGYAVGTIPVPGGTYSGAGTPQDPIIESVQLNAGSGNFGGDASLLWNTTYNHLIVNGPSNSKDYTLSGGIFVQPANGKSALTITSGSATDNAYINFAGGTASSAEQFAFAIGRDGTNGTGMVKIADTIVAEFDSDGIKMASTKGIKFSPYGSGNVLDSYQEGTWTPTPYYQNAGDQSAASFTTAEGYYTRIGNIVHVSGHVICSGPSSPANDNVGINSLPYNNALNIGAIGVIMFDAATGTTDVNIRMNPGASLAVILTTNGIGNLGDELGTSWEATFQITYRVL